MSAIAVEVRVRVEMCQIEDGECTVCFAKIKRSTPNKCPNGHKIGRLYGLENGRPPFPVVECFVNGTRCSICGGQFSSGGLYCPHGHSIGSYYEIR